MANLPTHNAPPNPDNRLIWSDEFDGSALDRTKWDYRYLGQRHDALNVPEAVTVENGQLVIRTYSVGSGASMKHHTGMIGTQGIFQQKYGYFEARIQFNGMPGIWSAFWIQTPTMGQPLGDPGKAGAEIDIIEHRVIDNSGTDIRNMAHHALHWDGNGPELQSRNTDTMFPNLAEGFHLYGVEWTPAGYKYYVDRQLTWTVTEGISNRDEYMILSSEVKNDGWVGRIPVGGYGSRANTAAKMIVDYVRVYELKPSAHAE